MQIATYISDLLYRHECVVLPGYGAFISRRVPAQHYESSHTIYPPKKGLSFNAQIQQNDGLLVNYVASVEAIPYQEALQQVRNYVRFLDHELDTKGMVTIHKIGRFTRNEEQSLQFTPMYLVNYLPEAFGLTAHETYAVDRTAVETFIPTTTVIESVTEPVTEEDTPVVPLHVPAKEKATPWLRYAAIGVVLLGLGGFVGNNAYQSHLVAADNTVQELANEKVNRQIQEATFEIPNLLPSIELEITPDVQKNFHVIAGAFRDPANADKKIKQLAHKGFNAQRLGVNKYGLHMVSFSSHTERNDAINTLNRLKHQGYSNAWFFVGTLER